MSDLKSQISSPESRISDLGYPYSAPPYPISSVAYNAAFPRLSPTAPSGAQVALHIRQNKYTTREIVGKHMPDQRML